MTHDVLEDHPQLRGHPRQMAMFCALLRDRGMTEDALAMGLAAIAAAPDDLAVRMEVGAALSRGVAPFHGPMLLDRARNNAYARAIEQAVRPGMLVLEIGAGSGLLALIAARAGATVVTCEANPLIAAAAQAVVKRNGYAERVTVVGKRSDAMLIPDDLPRPADLVIHEIFGSQLFDEGVIAALSDARRRLLKPRAPSVPRSATVRCALAGRAVAMVDASLGDVEGFDLSPFAPLVRPARSIWSSVRRGLERRSPPASLLQCDFDAPPPFGAPCETIELTCQDPRIDGIVQWIEIDFGNGERLENNPFEVGPDSAWAAAFLAFPEPMTTQPGDRVAVTARHRGRLVTLNAEHRPAG